MTTPAPASPIEGAWEHLWSQLDLRNGFWLGFVFESDLRNDPAVAERVVNEAVRRARVRRGGTGPSDQ